MILGRHRTTGFRFVVKGVSEEKLSRFNQARLFSRYFDCSKGFLITALRTWISSIQSVYGSRLIINPPEPVSDEALDDLPVEWMALLIQLLLHKSIIIDDLADVTGIHGIELKTEINSLKRAGLIFEGSSGILSINPYMYHVITRKFSSGGIL